MKTIVTKPLPHKIGSASISNAELRKVAMLLMENCVILAKQLADLQEAVRELQRKQ